MLHACGREDVWRRSVEYHVQHTCLAREIRRIGRRREWEDLSLVKGHKARAKGMEIVHSHAPWVAVG